MSPGFAERVIVIAQRENRVFVHEKVTTPVTRATCVNGATGMLDFALAHDSPLFTRICVRRARYGVPASAGPARPSPVASPCTKAPPTSGRRAAQPSRAGSERRGTAKTPRRQDARGDKAPSAFLAPWRLGGATILMQSSTPASHVYQIRHFRRFHAARQKRDNSSRNSPQRGIQSSRSMPRKRCIPSRKSPSSPFFSETASRNLRDIRAGERCISSRNGRPLPSRDPGQEQPRLFEREQLPNRSPKRDNPSRNPFTAKRANFFLKVPIFAPSTS